MDNENSSCPLDCKWRIKNRWQKCSCCRRNKQMKDNYEPNSKDRQSPTGKEEHNGKSVID